MPKRFLVTRHAGAVTWAARQGLRARKIEMSNFEPSLTRPGDVVMGTLPIHLVAELNQRGVHYWHLTMDVPEALRGRELSADDMVRCGARLHEFRVLPLGSRDEVMGAPEVWDDLDCAADRPTLHLSIATGQQLPNAVPILLTRWERVVIFASPRMRGSAIRLAAFVNDEAKRLKLPDDSGNALRYALPDSGDLAELRDAVQKAIVDLRVSYPRHQLVLNITGGLKLMTLAFADALRGQAHILYCDAERGVLEVVEPPGQSPQPIENKLDFHTYQRVQGFRVVRGGSPNPELEKSLRERESLTAKLALQLPKVELLKAVLKDGADAPKHRKETEFFSLMAVVHGMASNAVESSRNGDFVNTWHALLRDGTRIDPNGRTLLKELSKAGLLARGTDVNAAKSITLCFSDVNAAIYLSGGYLEEFAALSALRAHIPPENLGLNAHLDPLKPKENRKSDELNEIDVGVVWKARMLIIECKAGRAFAESKKAQDIQNKAVAIRNGYGGALATSLIVGNAYLNSRDKADIEERAKVNSLELMFGADALKGLPSWIARWAGLDYKKEDIDWKIKDQLLPANRPQTGYKRTAK